MKLEVLTNSLDIAAFLMVTTDLLGRERFAKFSNLLRSMPETSFRPLGHSDQNQLPPLTIGLMLKCILIPPAIPPILVLVFELPVRLREAHLYFLPAWRAFDPSLIKMLLESLGASITIIYFFIGFLALGYLTKIYFFLARKYSADGVLVIAGSLLFLTSRALGIWFATR